MGLGLWCLVLGWGPLHSRHVCVLWQRSVMWSKLQHFWHWDTGGLSWKALSEQCRPNAARAQLLRRFLALCSSSRANTNDDLGVVRSSSLVLSHLGLAIMFLVSDS